MMELYSFHASIHAQPEEAVAGPAVQLDGQKLATLQVPAPLLSQSLERDFEDVVEALAKWERMFVEPDGSFVWVSSQSAQRWQVDGNLNERDDLLLFVDIKGCCPPDEFDRLLAVLGWPGTQVMFQLTRQAVLVDESQFRQWALFCGARLVAGGGHADRDQQRDRPEQRR